VFPFPVPIPVPCSACSSFEDASHDSIATDAITYLADPLTRMADTLTRAAHTLTRVADILTNADGAFTNAADTHSIELEKLVNAPGLHCTSVDKL
jgi:hypothetical protein